MGKILTVSVAAYNMEKYLDECLASLAIPEIADELEVFVIDDGGTDRSLEIAQSYADKFPGTFIPVHKDNGGWGSTVNYSIAHATGKYFKILDGDDWFDRDGLVKLVDELKRSESEVIVTDYYEARPEGTTPKKILIPEAENACKLNEELLMNMPLLGLHVLCYRTNIIRQSKLICPEHKLYCDTYYQIIPFLEVDTIQSLPFPVSFYRMGREGQSIDINVKLKHQDELLWICRDIIALCSNAKATNGRNYLYIMRKTAEIYKYAIIALRYNPINTHSLEKIKELDSYLMRTSEDVYHYSASHCGRFIWLMRKTHYLSYWLNGLFRRHA